MPCAPNSPVHGCSSANKAGRIPSPLIEAVINVLKGLNGYWQKEGYGMAFFHQFHCRPLKSGPAAQEAECASNALTTLFPTRI